MIDYTVSKPGVITPATLADALRLHFVVKGRKPAGVAVHPLELAHAEQAVRALGEALPVTPNAGLLVGEIGLVCAR
jgi:hypothetical protein